MQRHTRTLTAFVGATALTLLAGTPSFALDIPTPLKYDMGPFGTWKVVGGVEAALSGWNNAAHTNNGNDAPNDGGTGAQLGGGSSIAGDIDLTNAMFIINSKGNMFSGGDEDSGLPLQFHAWVGEPPQTPVVGYTSENVSPNLYSSNGKHSLNNTGAASFLFKGWATYQPIDEFSIEAGRLPSVDGTEIGVGWLNNLPMLSDLNNMQTTVGDGVQINLMTPGDDSFYFGFLPGYGSTLTIRVADGYKTGHMNELGFVGLWNLTPDGSDFLMAYGHTRLSTVGNDNTVANGAGFGGTNPYMVGGYGLVNSNLIGVGTVFNLTSRLSMNAEVETQWLPESDIPAADRSGAAGIGNIGQQDYYRWSTQWTFAYDFGLQQIFGEPIRVGAAVQPEFTYQHANTSDPHANVFGNYLGLDVGPAGTTGGPSAGSLGTFGAGSKMYAIQAGPSFSYHNAFVRPTISYTHLASLDNGFGYGANGNEHDQVVLMLDFGWLLGQQEDTNSGQH